jgi:hypothetical protein
LINPKTVERQKNQVLIALKVHDDFSVRNALASN